MADNITKISDIIKRLITLTINNMKRLSTYICATVWSRDWQRSNVTCIFLRSIVNQKQDLDGEGLDRGPSGYAVVPDKPDIVVRRTYSHSHRIISGTVSGAVGWQHRPAKGDTRLLETRLQQVESGKTKHERCEGSTRLWRHFPVTNCSSGCIENHQTAIVTFRICWVGEIVAWKKGSFC